MFNTSLPSLVWSTSFSIICMIAFVASLDKFNNRINRPIPVIRCRLGVVQQPSSPAMLGRWPKFPLSVIRDSHSPRDSAPISCPAFNRHNFHPPNLPRDVALGQCFARDALEFLDGLCTVCRPVTVRVRWQPQSPDSGEDLV